MIFLRIFKNNRLGGLVALVLISVGLFMRTFLLSDPPAAYTDMPFYNLLFGQIHQYPFLNRLITLMLLWIICLILVRINNRYMLLDFRSYMPGFYLLFFAAPVPTAQQVTPALVGAIFYLICFAILFDAHDKKQDTYTVFNASLVLALGSMFYMKLIWFVPLIWISLATLRQVSLREILYPVVAYILLALFLLAWYWGIHDNSREMVRLLGKNLSFAGPFTLPHFSVYIFYGYMLLMILASSLYMAKRFQSRKTVIQNIYQVMFYMFVASILFLLLIARFNASGLVYVALPVSFILSDYFHRKRNHWTHELAQWVMVGLVVYQQFMA